MQQQIYMHEAWRKAVSRNMSMYEREIGHWSLKAQFPYFFIAVHTEEGRAHLTIERWGYLRRPDNTSSRKWYRVDSRGDWKSNMRATLESVVDDWGEINFTSCEKCQYRPPAISAKSKVGASRYSSFRSVVERPIVLTHHSEHVLGSTRISHHRTRPSLF